jgi:hypothetical protein
LEQFHFHDFFFAQGSGAEIAGVIADIRNFYIGFSEQECAFEKK